jgi:nicotinamidase-related amidase
VAAPLPIPAHFAPERVGEVWRVDYEQRAKDADRFAEEHALPPAGEDAVRTCLLVVDCQNTFCTPGFELHVPGAPDDVRRLCEFVYRNLASITQIVATLDTHRPEQIFHAAFLVGAGGRHPPPYTVVSVEDVETRRWRAVHPEHQQHLEHYVRALRAGGKYELAIWPYHAMLGGIGHALVSAIEEALFFHAIARQTNPSFEIKGFDPHTEHYSVLRPEVTAEHAMPELAARLAGYDTVLVAGQAKSHCVAWTVADLLELVPQIAPRLYLLEDCTSPVVVPGAVDYTAEADAAFRRFAEAGVNVVRSTDLS